MCVINLNWVKNTIHVAQLNPSKFKLAATTYSKKGIELAQAYNSTIKTHPWQAKLANLVGMPHRIYLHAEIAALIASNEPVEVLVVASVTKEGKPAMAKPCPVCQKALEFAHVKVLIYTGLDGQTIIERLNHG